MSKPFFMMLIGLPGSGKSSYAKSVMTANTEICSSDEMRKELFGDESIQEQSDFVFEKLLSKTKTLLSKGVNVIFDATNIVRKHRVHILNELPDCMKIATIVWAKYEECIERDRLRERTVGESVIRKMLCRFQPPYYDERWDVINIVIGSDEYTWEDYNIWLDCSHDNPHHNNSVAVHSEQVASLMAQRHTSPTMVFAAKLHDIGKKFVKRFSNAKGEPTDIAHFYHHQNVGSYYALGFNGLPDEDPDARLFVSWLINVHMDPFLNTKYYRNLPKELKQYVDILHECDMEGA